MLIVAGIRMSRGEVLALASMLRHDGFDRTERLLLAALTNGQEFVALTADDKECALAALVRRPTKLVELRGALFDELNWQRKGLAPPLGSRGFGAVTTHRRQERANVAWV
jgi:hypothetical protein